MIRLEHITKEFSSSNKKVIAVNDVSVHISKGEIYGIIGFSGAGKSTLVRCINLLEMPTSGKVYFGNQELTSAGEKELRHARQKMGMIFQQFHLLEQRNVLKNICYPLELAGVSKKDRIKRAKELLRLVDMEEKEKSYPSQLSGGQKQRVAIARALATNPEVLLCDEATSALDVSIQDTIISLLVKLQREKGISILFICHDIALIQAFAHQIAVMYLGHIVEVLPRESVAKGALHPYTQALVGALFSVHMNPAVKLQSIEGEAPSPLELPIGCPFQNRCPHCMEQCKQELPELIQYAPGHFAACHYTANGGKPV